MSDKEIANNPDLIFKNGENSVTEIAQNEPD
jgi:hypothetical protein